MHKPGLIGIVSSTMGRYREFDVCLRGVSIPTQSRVTYEVGLDIAYNFNNLCKKLLERKELEWLWILGDDHVFKPDILNKLLDRNVDIVTPLCLKRSMPFHPTMYKPIEGLGLSESDHMDMSIRGTEFYAQMEWDDLKNESGLIEVIATGNAGMVIRRNVIEKIGDDWHRVGWRTPDRGGSDLYFCKRARENGFKLYVDLDNSIGHVTHMAVWPVKNSNGEYSAGIREAMDMPTDKFDKIETVKVKQ